MTPPHPPNPARPARGRVLIAGGTGFTGRAIALELSRTRRADDPPLRVLARRLPPAPTRPDDHATQYTTADLADTARLRAACEGVTTLIHTASHTGRDAARCDTVNRAGTRNLLEAARQAGVHRVLYLSTASVYGTGPHHNAGEQRLTPRPQSPASATRLQAEHAVREAGGIVLRPHLVCGEGDRWVVPTIARMLARVPHWPEHTAPRSSMITVEDLARLVTALADSDTLHPGTVYHAAHPRPVGMRALVSALCPLLGLPRPHGGLSPGRHRELCARHMPELTGHQYALLTQDHSYDSSLLWRHTGIEPGPAVLDRLASYAGWYTRHLDNTA